MVKKSVAGIAFEGRSVFIAHRVPVGQMGDRWEFPGGKVENNEDNALALKREYKEEFGIDIEVKNLITQNSFMHNGEEVLLFAYEVLLPTKKDTESYSLSEHTEYKWIDIEDIPSLNFVDSDMLIYPKVKEYILATAGKNFSF